MDGDVLDDHATASCEDLLLQARTMAEGGGLQQAEAKCNQLIERCPNRVDGWRLRGSMRLSAGEARAIDDFRHATELLPSCVPCWRELAWAQIRFGELVFALDALERSLSLESDDAPSLSSRAFVLNRLGRPEDALDSISRAIALRPNHDSDIHNRAVILTALGRYREAIEDYHRVLEIRPESAGTHNNLAWLLATCPDSGLRDGPKAVDHARSALAVANLPAWMDTLAAALAERGDFDQAVAVEEQAYALSKPPNESFRMRALLYQKRTTYATWRAKTHDARNAAADR